MPPDIDQLPYHTRQAILAQVRDQVGDAAFEQLVAQFGEDGLLRMVLAESSRHAGTGRPPEPAKKSEPGGWLIAAIFLGAGAAGAAVACLFELDANAAREPMWKRGLGGFFVGLVTVVVIGWVYFNVVVPLLAFGGWVNKTADDMTHSMKYWSYEVYERSKRENRIIMWVFVGIVIALLVGLLFLIRWLVT